jgi:hypothetical protein
MAILETLTTTVGVSIAKGLLNIWLKDQPFSNSFGSEVLDLLKEKSKDVITARRGGRFFEAYEVEPDKIGLRKVSVESVAKEVSNAIDTSKISSKLLSSLNYSPAALLKHINKSYSVKNRALSESEISLYSRALDRCCQYIVDIAPTLPDYTSSNFVEVLERLGKTMDKVDEILQELSNIGSASEKHQKQQGADFERNLRASVVRKFDKINLFGADVKRQAKRYKLDVIGNKI